jgi:hypothetical protein
MSESSHVSRRSVEISMDSLPHLPLLFQWNWWGITLFMVTPAIPIAMVAVIFRTGPLVDAMAVIAIPLLAAISSAYYVYGYLRFALKGPSFVLDADGIAFAGRFFPWRDVTRIDYMPSGRTPSIRFRLTGSEAKGFSVFDQFYGKTSISARFISDPAGLVKWSRRLKEESLKSNS